MRQIYSLLIILFCFSLQSKQVLLDRIYATANEAAITETEVLTKASELKDKYINDNKIVPSKETLIKEAADALIIESLEYQLLYLSGKEGLNEILLEPIKIHAKSLGLSEQAYITKYKPKNISIKEFETFLRNSIIHQNIHGSILRDDRKASEQQIKEIIEENQLNEKFSEYTFTEYLFVPTDDSKESMQKAVKAAQNFNKKIKEGAIAKDVILKIDANDDFEIKTTEFKNKLFNSIDKDYLKGLLKYHGTEKTIYNELLDKTSVLIIHSKNAKVIMDNKITLYKISLEKQTKENINKIKNIKKTVKNLEDFKVAALTYSHDIESAKVGGKLEPMFSKTMPSYLRDEVIIYEEGEMTDILYKENGGLEIYWIEKIEKDNLAKYAIQEMAVQIYNNQQNELQVKENRAKILSNSIVRFLPEDEPKS